MKPFLFNISLITFSLALTGCNILPDISGASVLSESIKEQEENQQKLLTQTQMTDFIAEWQNMKPAITSLISLESDLQFVLKQLEQEQQQPLRSALDVQKGIVLQEMDDRLDNLEFAVAPNIAEKFVENPPEVAELAETAIFADAELLDTFKGQSDPQLSGTFNESTDVELLTSFVESTDAQLVSSFDKGGDAKLLASFGEPYEPTVLVSLNAQMTEGETQYTDVKTPVNLQTKGIKPLAQHLIETKQKDSASKVDAKFAQKHQADSFNEIDTKFAQKKQAGDALLGAYSESTANSEALSANKFSVHTTTTSVQMDQKFSLASDPSLIVGDVRKKGLSANIKKPQEQTLSCQLLTAELGSGYAVHLASYSKQSSAKAGWSDLIKKFEKNLCGLTPVLKEVNVNGKQFFSLRAGGFQTKAEADSACVQITQTQQYCKSTRFDGTLL